MGWGGRRGGACNRCPPYLLPRDAVVQVLACLQVSEQAVDHGAATVLQHARGQALTRQLITQAKAVARTYTGGRVKGGGGVNTCVRASVRARVPMPVPVHVCV